MEDLERKVLVVDDNAEFAGMVRRLLESQGYRVSIAATGNLAMERVISDTPHVILLDLKLPDIPGMEVLQRIKSIKPDIAIIILTGYGGEQVAVDFMKAGTMDFLSKPVDKDLLLKAIKNAFKIKEMQADDLKWDRQPSLEKFFPFLAHEIRNPLHAIGGALAIIQRRSDTKDEVLGESIKIIQEEVEHLNEFVQECLDFVRPPAKSRFIEVQINDTLSTVINIVSHMFEGLSRKVDVTLDLDPDLPKILANYEEIKQAFVNIVKNAFESMTDGGGFTVRTRFNPNPPAGAVIIEFKDQGIGIKKETYQYLFRPFFTTKFRGTGLGLAICRRIVMERHDGNIRVESGWGKGTTVTVELPVGLT